jgi:hypothetical protein
MKSRENLMELLIKMHDVILSERQAAKELKVVKVLELKAEKEALLKKILPFSDTAELTQEEKELSRLFILKTSEGAEQVRRFRGQRGNMLVQQETAFEAALNATSGFQVVYVSEENRWSCSWFKNHQ